MSFIELTGLNEVKEPELAPEGEYDLRIGFADDYIKEGTKKMIVRCSIAIEGHPEYAAFNHWTVVYDPEDDDDQRKMRALRTARFLTLFNVPFENGFEVEDLFGATAVNVFVTQSEEDDQGNTYNELRVPRMK